MAIRCRASISRRRASISAVVARSDARSAWAPGSIGPGEYGCPHWRPPLESTPGTRERVVYTRLEASRRQTANGLGKIIRPFLLSAQVDTRRKQARARYAEALIPAPPTHRTRSAHARRDGGAEVGPRSELAASARDESGAAAVDGGERPPAVELRAPRRASPQATKNSVRKMLRVGLATRQQHVPDRIRTGVTGVKGRCPRPD